MFTLNGHSDPSHGTVQVDVKSYGYVMTVTVVGLNPNTQHEINIHAGTCANQDTDSLILHVDFLAADASGTIKSVTTWPKAYAVPANGRILTVHGDYNTSDMFVHIDCTEMTG
jgi:hypothetical protein